MKDNKYIGKWLEPESTKIDWELTPTNALRVLQEGVNPQNSKYTHRDIAHWCCKFWNKYSDVDAPDEIEDIMPILADVETQWDLYLANTYNLKELQELAFHEVQLPTEWFENWIKQIKKAEPAI